MSFCICMPTVLGGPDHARDDCLIHGNTAKVLNQIEEDLNTGIQISLNEDTWTWYPSAGDVLDAVREAIRDPSVSVPSYRQISSA